nr:MAG TPA: nucelotide kinase [Caudoviricetes sp.]
MKKMKTSKTHPEHYAKQGIEPIDYIEANNLNFSEGNIIKYVTRHRKKGGKKDLLKARWYINRLIKTEYGSKE